VIRDSHMTRPPQSAASCRLSARHILKKAIMQAHLIKTTQIRIIYKGRHIFLPLSMPGTLSDCGGLHMTRLNCVDLTLYAISQNRHFSIKKWLFWEILFSRYSSHLFPLLCVPIINSKFIMLGYSSSFIRAFVLVFQKLVYYFRRKWVHIYFLTSKFVLLNSHYKQTSPRVRG
jgi:hypothetical protein